MNFVSKMMNFVFKMTDYSDVPRHDEDENLRRAIALSKAEAETLGKTLGKTQTGAVPHGRQGIFKDSVSLMYRSDEFFDRSSK